MNHPTGCTGPCEQGRKLCPTPHACGIASPVDDDPPQQDIVRVVLQDLAVSIAVLAVFAVIVLWVAGELG